MEENTQGYRLVYNAIQTPDGTILNSKSRHDFVSHTDKKDGLYYAVDGGLDYIKLVYDDGASHKDISLYENDDFTEIRKVFVRYNNILEQYVPLCKMEHAWLENTIDYLEERGAVNSVHIKMYRMEMAYRLDLYKIYITELYEEGNISKMKKFDKWIKDIN